MSKKYTSIREKYYKEFNQDANAAQKFADELRLQDGSYDLHFPVGKSSAFVVISHEIIRQISMDIPTLLRKIDQVKRSLPHAALIQYLNQAIAEEIHQSNKVEGVHSTRREILDAMDAVMAGRRENPRFGGMISKYRLLLGSEKIPFQTCKDVRALYDDFILSEVQTENPDNVPDGTYFREKQVGIYSKFDQKIHTGMFPESKIIQAMEQALATLNNADIPPLIRIAAFHYMFGYIHPFYDGNGRMGRFISSWFLKTQDNIQLPVECCLRLSYVIKDQRSAYYKLFKDTNDAHNYGDLTDFVAGFIGFVVTACQQTLDQLANTRDRIREYASIIKGMQLDEAEKAVLRLMSMVSICSEVGIDIDTVIDTVKQGQKSKISNILRNLSSYLIIGKRGNRKLYRADLGVLDQLRNDPDRSTDSAKA